MIPLTLPRPLPALPALTRFGLNQVFDSPGLYSLESAEAPDTKIFVLDPRLHLPDYAPSLDGALGSIGDPVGDDVKIFLILDTSEEVPAVNLMTPLAVNTETLTAAQVTLENQDYPVREQLELLTPA